MSIASISSNYTERRRDISIFQYPDASIVDAQTITPAFGHTSRMCAGVQKLVQKYAIILLTNISSQENFPTFGSNFLYPLQTGAIAIDTLTVTQLFKLASYEVVKTLQRYQIEHPEIPDDEKIVTAQLTDLSVAYGAANFSVTITTEAGDAVDFIIPIPK